MLLDFAGIGIGPSNLSLAALCHPLNTLSCRFFDAKPQFSWHPGLLFPEAAIQVPFAKDLVTLVDPSSQLSFLMFLRETNRLYAFLNAGFSRVLRCEFLEYYQWAASKLDDLEFNCQVQSIATCADGFSVKTNRDSAVARNIVLGVGHRPRIPMHLREYLGGKFFHAADYLHHKPRLAGRRVAIIGGGQTAAETVLYILSNERNRPEYLGWFSRRMTFLPLDETPFTNEFFTPNFAQYFFNLSRSVREQMLAEQKLASDGIMSDLLHRVYALLYQLRYVEKMDYDLRPSFELQDAMESGQRWTLNFEDVEGKRCVVPDIDYVILCTGFECSLPECLRGLSDLVECITPRQDYSLPWHGPERHRIYVQNGARSTHGIADANLSLNAWRSAVIINSICDQTIYDVPPTPGLICWR